MGTGRREEGKDEEKHGLKYAEHANDRAWDLRRLGKG